MVIWYGRITASRVQRRTGLNLLLCRRSASLAADDAEDDGDDDDEYEQRQRDDEHELHLTSLRADGAVLPALAGSEQRGGDRAQCSNGDCDGAGREDARADKANAKAMAEIGRAHV